SDVKIPHKKTNGKPVLRGEYRWKVKCDGKSEKGLQVRDNGVKPAMGLELRRAVEELAERRTLRVRQFGDWLREKRAVVNKISSLKATPVWYRRGIATAGSPTPSGPGRKTAG
ncbi:hypothetical protein, partial [Salmonella enterica]|uniref:hypothetical protein n=1 Tax=Salmonella enterica TaxID=28901 RepID=UPI00398C5BCE